MLRKERVPPPGPDQVFFAIFADFFAIFVLKGFLLD
jgi:hypothetical protein